MIVIPKGRHYLSSQKSIDAFHVKRVTMPSSIKKQDDLPRRSTRTIVVI